MVHVFAFKNSLGEILILITVLLLQQLLILIVIIIIIIIIKVYDSSSSVNRRRCLDQEVFLCSSGYISGLQAANMATHMSRCRPWSRVQRYYMFYIKIFLRLLTISNITRKGSHCVFNTIPRTNSSVVR